MWIIYSPSFFGFFLKDISSYWKTLFYFKLLSIKHTVVHISYIPLHSRMTALNTILKFYQFSILVARYLSFISSTHYLNSKMRLRQYNFKILSYKWPGGQTWALFSAQLFTKFSEQYYPFVCETFKNPLRILELNNYRT